MIIVDSDILIWILRGDAGYKEQFREAVRSSSGRIYITPIQYMEILAGVRNKEAVTTRLFLDSLGMIPIDKETGGMAGYFLKVRTKPHGIHNADALIAAAVKGNDCQLWTNNTRHYPMLAKDELYRP